MSSIFKIRHNYRYKNKLEFHICDLTNKDIIGLQFMTQHMENELVNVFSDIEILISGVQFIHQYINSNLKQSKYSPVLTFYHEIIAVRNNDEETIQSKNIKWINQR